MADLTLIQIPPNEPPKKDCGAYYLSKRLEEIANHLDDLSTLLYENQDQGKDVEVGDLIIGLQSLIRH